MEINILRCELVRLLSLYAARLQWGFDCDLDLLFNRALTIRNQIAILEELCLVDPSVLRCITIDVNRIQRDNPIDLCTNC